MYWQQEYETIPRKKLEALQIQLLNKTVKHAKKSEFYRDKLKTFPADGIKTVKTIQSLPFTVKDDLRNSFPYGMLAVNIQSVIRLHSSSGTTGNPTVVYHTRKDIDNWATLIARCMYMSGVRDTDVFQNTMGYGLFTGGLGFHYGAEKIGMLTIPIGPGNSKRQIWFMQKFGTTVMHILPSYALRLTDVFKELNLDPKKDVKLRIAFIGAEPHSEEMRKQIENLYEIKCYNSYGLSEMCGPGIAFECSHQNGMHLWEDHFYPEIINPDTCEVLPDGEEGELVLTTLQRQAMPLIRYRTRDLTHIISTRCSCGRTHRRIARITGRSDDMLIINGVNIFPIQIERTILRIPGVGNNYIIELTKESFMDKLIIKIEINENIFRGTLTELEQIQRKVTEELRSELGLNPIVQLVEPNSLPAAEGKAQRVYDFRKKSV
ncbi:MAG: phenylacetate--CoA ligase [Elusimicrobiota bacterium]